MIRCSTLAVREMQIKTTVRYRLIASGMVVIKKTVTNVGEDTEKLEPSYTACEYREPSYSALENGLAVPQLLKQNVTMWPMSAIEEKQVYPHQKNCKLMSLVALFIIAASETHHETWYIHPVEYYLAGKRNEVLTCTTGKNLKNSYVQWEKPGTKDRTYDMWPHVYETSRRSKSIETGRLVVVIVQVCEYAEGPWIVQFFSWFFYLFPKE